jgi:hypothetical protein
MNEIHDIVASVLDRDGSCRDLNFDAPTWEGVRVLLEYVLQRFPKHTATDAEGAMPVDRSAAGLVTLVRTSGALHLVLQESESEIVRHLQVFVFREEDGQPFVELTFFPQDVAEVANLRDDFLQWLHALRGMLEARRCYARYENASWTFGDTAPNSGVFAVL